MWLLWVCILFAPSLAFPFGDLPQHYHGLLQEFGDLPILNSFQRPSPFCVPSPFIGRLCLPSISRLLSPVRTLQVKKQGCVTIPLVPEYVVKICSANEATEQGDNFKEPSKEINKVQEQEKKEEEEEHEPEPFSDNAILQVNGKEDEAEKFVEKEGKDKSESQLEQDVDAEAEAGDDVRNQMIQVSEEIIRFNNGNNSPEPTAVVNDVDDENVSITSNLV